MTKFDPDTLQAVEPHIANLKERLCTANDECARLHAVNADLLEALERTTFLLQRITEGDHRALENATHGIEQASSAIRKARES